MNNRKIELISKIKFVYPFIFDPRLFSKIKGNIFIKDFSVDYKGKNKRLKDNGEILVWEKDDSFPKDDLIRLISKYIILKISSKPQLGF